MKKALRSIRLLATTVFLLCPHYLPSPVTAQIPQKINYQGKLTDLNAAAIPDGTYDMRFSLYDAESGGTLVWGPEGWTTITRQVDVTDGIFSVTLGEHSPLTTAAFDTPYWLEVEIYNETNSVWESFSPRNQLTSTPYALRAHRVADNSIDTASIATASITTEKIADGGITDEKVASSGFSALKITSDLLDNARVNWASPGVIGATTPAHGHFSELIAENNVAIGTTSPSGRVHIESARDTSGLVFNLPSITNLPDAGYTHKEIILWQGGETKFGKWRNYFNAFEQDWALTYNAPWDYTSNTWLGRDSGDSRANIAAYMRFNIAEGNSGANTYEITFAPPASAGVAPDWNAASQYWFYDGRITPYPPRPARLRIRGAANMDAVLNLIGHGSVSPLSMELISDGVKVFGVKAQQFTNCSGIQLQLNSLGEKYVDLGITTVIPCYHENSHIHSRRNFYQSRRLCPPPEDVAECVVHDCGG